MATGFANLSALIEADANDSPFRPSRAVLVQGVNRSPDFDRILSLPRRAEDIDPAIAAALNAWLRTDEHRRWTALRKAWWEVAGVDAEHAAAAYVAVPDARELPEVKHGKASEPDKPQESLRIVQACALADAFQFGGLFAPIGVGHGKFLISILLITLIEDGRARDGLPPLKWLLLVPANLLKQTHAELAKARRHWRTPKLWTQAGVDGGGIRIESYDKLSSAKSAEKILQDFRPDAVVADECHKLKRMGSGRTRKFMRYMRVDHPGTLFFGMSGSITRKTVRDYWHLIHLALPNHPPLPRSFAETEEWCQALDDAPDSDFRRAPGALLDLCDPDEIEALAPGWKASPELAKLSYYGETPEKQDALLEIVRKGYRRRLRETPGVVATADGALGTSLVIAERVPPIVPPRIVEVFKHLRTTWQTPNGDEIDGGVSLWRHACELASGFWYRWDPVAPKEWLAARQDWNRFVRYVLAHNRQRLDTPLQVVQAVESDRLSSAFDGGRVFLDAWRNVRDTFEPNPVPQWESTWLVEDAIAWFDEQCDDDGKAIPDKCVAWVGLAAVGEKIEELSGGRIKHFGGGADASSKILTHKGPIVCSIPAHGTGKNLQRYSRNLVIHWPSGADIAEQLLGRTHRPGQDADEVRVDVYMHALELRAAFDTAIRGANYIEKSTGATQKLTYASVSRRSTEDAAILTASNDPLWRK